jgi:hypothetical protein
MAYRLASSALQIAADPESSECEMTDALIGELMIGLREIQAETEHIGLESTHDAIGVILGRWEDYHNKRLLMTQCAQLEVTLECELKRKVGFILPRSSQKLYENPRENWEAIIDVFPEIADDVEEMNRCRAFGRDAASVFHVLLVVEYGLIDLGKFLRVSTHGCLQSNSYVPAFAPKAKGRPSQEPTYRY